MIVSSITGMDFWSGLYAPWYILKTKDVVNPKTPWDVMGCQNHLFGGPRGVTRRVWCFHRRGREP